MGVESLWKVLDPIKQSKSLLMVAEEHRTHANSTGIAGDAATFTVGVDFGTLIGECNGGARAAGVYNQQAGGGLYLFFKRLAELIMAPVNLVFVLDGPDRPNIKRGHEVRRKSVWWLKHAIQLVGHFGHVVHQAPGEAEAELARLNKEGHIQAVITSDSDAYLFGTESLLRSIPISERKFPDEYSLYNAEAGVAPLTRDGIILFALLKGGDYGPGIDKCGTATALALAKCGFGDQLLYGFRNLNGQEFDGFLIQWRCAIRHELLTNSQHQLSQRKPSLSAAIPDTFPNRRILDLYANPITSWSFGRAPPDVGQWTFKQPSIRSITRFCRDHFRRDKNPMKLRQLFKGTLWSAVFLQSLYSPSAVYSPEEHRLESPGPGHPSATITKTSRRARQGQYTMIYGDEPQPMLVVSVPEFVKAMGLKFADSLSKDTITVWPRESLLPESLRQQLQEIKKKPAKKRTARPTSLPVAHEKKEVNIAHEKEEVDWIQIGENHWYADLTSD